MPLALGPGLGLAAPWSPALSPALSLQRQRTLPGTQVSTVHATHGGRHPQSRVLEATSTPPQSHRAPSRAPVSQASAAVFSCCQSSWLGTTHLTGVGQALRTLPGLRALGP